ncbi:bifunctional DNA primase/polymerase [Streptomyces sp. J2-1]|uniref:bifunctional DNA primase/polymerase n=1 Tax=Streptomyces corallincola TaxID=2851888 RepID=UPI001C3888D8|nr:bifunctional DNA primase/polymerase [Streptomyces corallincola]MBV2353703.1 bifunctional DNA primase/polymerase [Streptomyces corallincola]
MSATFGGRAARQGRLSQWLRKRPRETGDAGGREALLLAAAQAGLPLAPAAHPADGYGCSCDRVGCPTPARHPVSFAWQTQSTTDAAQIERWARSQPEANFITATGMVHDVLDVPLAAGREALERLTAAGIDVGPVAESDDGRLLFFTLTRGTPEDEDEWWPCELDCHPETMDEHPGLRWHCRGSYVLVPPAALPGDGNGDANGVRWVRGPEHPLPDPLSLLEILTDECARYVAAGDPARDSWPPVR